MKRTIAADMGRRTRRMRPLRFRRGPSMILQRRLAGCQSGQRASEAAIAMGAALPAPTMDLEAIHLEAIPEGSGQSDADVSPDTVDLSHKITERVFNSLEQARATAEEAVLSIGHHISALFDLANHSNHQATESLSSLVGRQSKPSQEQSSLQYLLDRQRKSIQLLIDRTQRFVQHQSQLVKESNARFRKMKSSITRISSFTSGSRLLAMNAHIESARLGPHGKAFAIVAGEMKMLSGQIKEANDQIERAVRRVSDTMQRLHQDAAAMEDELSSFSEKLAAEVADIEGRTQTLTASLGETLSQITASNEELMKHSLTAMSELQFQDPMAQALMRTGYEVRKLHALLLSGTCQDIDLAEIDERVGFDGTEFREAGEVELF